MSITLNCTAEKVLRGSFNGAGREVFLDITEPNAARTLLAQDLRTTEVFSNGRIYSKTIPSAPLNNVFGVTSFVLG